MCTRGYLKITNIFVTFITETKIENDMDELTRLLDKMPEVIRVKDGDLVVNCKLTFYYSHKYKEPKWTASYHCVEYDYLLCCGYGNTLFDAVRHLRRTMRGIKVKDSAAQYDYIL